MAVKTNKQTRKKVLRNKAKAATAKHAPGGRKKVTKKRKTSPRKTLAHGGRIAAPRVRLGMAALEVRACCGKPECILFGTDDHVEWQFGARGVDNVGAPTLFVTALTFAKGRVVRITERMTDPV